MTAEVSLLPTEVLVESAFDIAMASSITLYDALYVAASAELDCEMVTADRRLVTGLAGTVWADHAILLRDWASRFDEPPRDV